MSKLLAIIYRNNSDLGVKKFKINKCRNLDFLTKTCFCQVGQNIHFFHVFMFKINPSREFSANLKWKIKVALTRSNNIHFLNKGMHFFVLTRLNAEDDQKLLSDNSSCQTLNKYHKLTNKEEFELKEDTEASSQPRAAENWV